MLVYFVTVVVISLPGNCTSYIKTCTCTSPEDDKEALQCHRKAAITLRIPINCTESDLYVIILWITLVVPQCNPK